MPPKRKSNHPDRDPPSDSEVPVKKGRQGSSNQGGGEGGRTTRSSTRLGKGKKTKKTKKREPSAVPEHAPNTPQESEEVPLVSSAGIPEQFPRTRAQHRRAGAQVLMAPAPAAPAPPAAPAQAAPPTAAAAPSVPPTATAAPSAPRTAAPVPAGPRISAAGPAAPATAAAAPSAPRTAVPVPVAFRAAAQHPAAPPAASRPASRTAAQAPGLSTTPLTTTPRRPQPSPRPSATPLTKEAAAFYRKYTGPDDEFNVAHRKKLSKIRSDPVIMAAWVKTKEAKLLMGEAQRQRREEEKRLAAARQARLNEERRQHERARRVLLNSMLAEEQEAQKIANELPEEERRQQEKIERQSRKEENAEKHLLRAKEVARTRREAEIAQATATQALEEARFYKENADMALRRLTDPSSDAFSPVKDQEPVKPRGRVDYPTILREGMFDQWFPKGKGKARAESVSVEEATDGNGMENQWDEEMNEEEIPEEDVQEEEMQEEEEDDEEIQEEDEEDEEDEEVAEDEEDAITSFFGPGERVDATKVTDLHKKFLDSIGDVTPTESELSGSDFEAISAQEKRRRAQKQRREMSDTEEEDNEEDAVLAKEAVPSSPVNQPRAVNTVKTDAKAPASKPESTASTGSNRGQGGSISRDVQAAGSELGASIFRQVEEFAMKSKIPVPVALKLVKMTMPVVKREANIWNKFQFVLARNEPIEGEDREAFIARAQNVYRLKTDSGNSAEQVQEFFDEVERDHTALITDPVNLKHPHVRAVGLAEDIRDMFIRIAQTQPDFIPVGLLIYAGDDPAAIAASGIVTGSEMGKAILEKTSVPVQSLLKNLTNLFRGELAARNLGIASEVVKDVTRQEASNAASSSKIVTASSSKIDNPSSSKIDVEPQAPIPRRKRGPMLLDPLYAPALIMRDEKEEVSSLLRTRQSASFGVRILLRTVKYEMGVNVRWQLLAAIAFEKQVTWCGFPRIKGRCPGYNVYNTQGFNLADWQLLETAFTKRTLTLQKWTQAQSSYKPGTAEYNLIPLVVACDGIVECTVGDKQLFEAQKQRKKLAVTTNNLIPMPNYKLPTPDAPEVEDDPADPGAVPPAPLSPRSEILMLRAELEKLGGAKVPAFNFQGYTIISPSGNGTGDPNELFQLPEEDDTSAYHTELSKARQPVFVEGSSKPPPAKKARFGTPRFSTINYFGKKATPPSGCSLRALPIKKSNLGKEVNQPK